MKSERARRIEELFLAASNLGPAERRALLDQAAASEPELRAEIESLLEHDAAGAHFLSGAAAGLSETADTPRPARIGTYRIVSELGRGGMGIVYLAEQEHPRRQVALKVIRPGLASPSSLRRFEREAELLARLQHPGIAQVFEAGTADSGAGPQAFLAMELVQGLPLSAYAAANSLGTRERLRLLAQVCDAVEHAHRRGVIHRDLKPSNVLVDAAAGDAQAKVLDFGIARAMDAEALTNSLRTDVGQVVGTLPYMSPEQAHGEAERVDTRSDVYSLGVIGYELACGRLPLDVAGKPLHEALRIVREDEPTPLSRVAPVLRGDVETILGKALEKEPERRYDSAAAFAADLRRYLDDRPILARPPSRAYVLAKFARRNRATVAGVVAVFAALVLGLGATTRQAIVAAAERDRANDAVEEAQRENARAEREMRRAKAVARFQREMLSRVQPDFDGRDVKLAAVLDAAAASLPGELDGDAAVEGGVRKTLGESYHALGMLVAAERQFRAASELLDASLGAEHEETIDTQGWLSTTVADLGRLDEATALLENAYLSQCALFGREDPSALVMQLNLAELYHELGRLAEAELLARENLEARRRLLPEDDPRCANALTVLGGILWSAGSPAEAEELMRQALIAGRASQGARHPNTLTRSAMLASVLLERGEFGEAEELFRGALAIGSEVLGDEHFELLAWKHNLAMLLERAGRPGEAEELLREVVETHARVLGDGHPDTATAVDSLARLLARQGCTAQAEDVLQATIERLLRSDGEGHPSIAALRSRLAEVQATASAAR